MKSLRYAWILSAALFISCTSDEGGAEVETENVEATTVITEVDAAKAATLIEEEKDLMILDIRTPEEYAEGHIAGARLVNFKSDSFEEEVAKLELNIPYLVHCRSGSRSGQSMPIFEKLGFEKIYHLTPGMNGWVEAGNPVQK